MATRRRWSQQADSLAVGHQLGPCVCCRYRRFQMGGMMRRRRANKGKGVRKEWILKVQTKRSRSRSCLVKEPKKEMNQSRSTSEVAAAVLLLCHRHDFSTSVCCSFWVLHNFFFASLLLILTDRRNVNFKVSSTVAKPSHLHYPQLSGCQRRME